MFFFLKYLDFKFYTIDRPLGSKFQKIIIIFRSGGEEKCLSSLDVSLRVSPDGNSRMMFRISVVLFH